jgi:hypothetical protein
MKHPRAEIHEAFHPQLPPAVYKYPSIVERPRNEEETGQNFVMSSEGGACGCRPRLHGYPSSGRYLVGTAAF